MSLLSRLLSSLSKNRMGRGMQEVETLNDRYVPACISVFLD